MVGVDLNTYILTIGFIFVIGLIFESRFRMNSVALDMEERLDLLERALEVVGGVLTKLPELVPQFSINQSPLGQILEFFQSVKEPGESSYQGEQLREPTGKYSDGSEKEEITTTENPDDFDHQFS